MKEKQEGRGYEGGTPGMYSVHEDGPSAIDEEIRRLSFVGDRTQKLSSCADGSWGSPPVRVGRCQAYHEDQLISWSLFVFSKKMPKVKKDSIKLN